MTLEEVEEEWQHEKASGSPLYANEDHMDWLISEVKTWKQGCQDLAEEQDGLEKEIRRLRAAIEKHRDTPIIYHRDCTSALQGDYFDRDEELYKALEEKNDQ